MVNRHLTYYVIVSREAAPWWNWWQNIGVCVGPYHCKEEPVLELVAEEGSLFVIVRTRQCWNWWQKRDSSDHNKDELILTHVEGWSCMLTILMLWQRSNWWQRDIALIIIRMTFEWHICKVGGVV